MANQDQASSALANIAAMLMVDTTIEEVNERATNQGKYHAEEKVGKGAFGTVFRARTKDGHNVAIKICKTDVGIMQGLTCGLKSSDLLRQAIKEAKCLNELRHPYVLELLEVYDFNSQHGGKGIAIVTEYCTKGSLRQYLMNHRPEDPEERFKWYAQLADAMQYIHSQGVVHRDIKPANILIDSGGDIKVGDVGLAKTALDLSKSLKGNIEVAYGMYMKSYVGTALYMAPEVHSEHYPQECDIFSLGLVFVVIAESPHELNPIAKYAGQCKPLGLILHEHDDARHKRPIDLLNFEMKCATVTEQRLFNNMLEYSYAKRPTAKEVVHQIEDMNKARGFKLKEQSVQEKAAPTRQGCC